MSDEDFERLRELAGGGDLTDAVLRVFRNGVYVTKRQREGADILIRTRSGDTVERLAGA